LEPGGHLRDLADAETQPLKLVGVVDAVGDAGFGEESLNGVQPAPSIHGHDHDCRRSELFLP
jgi:hypothetical protein